LRRGEGEGGREGRKGGGDGSTVNGFALFDFFLMGCGGAFLWGVCGLGGAGGEGYKSQQHYIAKHTVKCLLYYWSLFVFYITVFFFTIIFSLSSLF